MTLKTSSSESTVNRISDDQLVSTRTVTEWYEVNAELIAEEFESVEFEKIHSVLQKHLPQHPCSVLDIGAGSGRDAAGLVKLGHNVCAVEPSNALRSLGQAIHQRSNVRWIDDKLPELKKFKQPGKQFDVVFLSAVWMHLSPVDRPPSFKRILDLLRPGGLLYLTLRHGPFDKVEGFWDIPDDEVVSLAKNSNLIEVTRVNEDDHLNRPGVNWTRMVWRRSPG